MSIICGRTGMDKIFEVKSTTGQIMNVYEDIETFLSLSYPAFSNRFVARPLFLVFGRFTASVYIGCMRQLALFTVCSGSLLFHSQ